MILLMQLNEVVESGGGGGGGGGGVCSGRERERKQLATQLHTIIS